MKRKVLIVPSWYPSHASPVNGIFVQDQAVALSQQYDVAVLFPEVSSGWRQLAMGRVGPEARVDRHEEITVYREQLLMPGPRPLAAINLLQRIAQWDGKLSKETTTVLWHLARYRGAVQRGFRRLLDSWGRPDVIHAHVVLPAGWAATRLGLRHSIPVVLTEHSSPFSVHLASKHQRRLAKDTVTQVDRVIAVSPDLARQISNVEHSLKIAVIGNVVKTAFFRPAEPSQERPNKQIFRFLTVALLSKQKGIDYLLDAARLLLQRGLTGFNLVIGGDGPERTRLQRKSEHVGLANHCQFLGLLTPAEVKQSMQQCDAFVLPSLHETFGIVLGEAMACGKPVISTRCGGPEFVVPPDAGLLVDVAKPEALADAMEKLVVGRVKFDPMLIRRQVVERFGEEAFLQNISRMYEQVWSPA